MAGCAAHSFYVAVYAFLALAASACTPGEPIGGTSEPEWINEISAPILKSEADVDTLWQSKPRCCGESQVVTDARIFYKACSDSIARYPDNEHLVVKCLWLMDLPLDTERRLAIHERLLNEHFYYRGSLRNCVNCDYADIVTRTAGDVAYIYESNGRSDDAISLLENVLDERGAETSPWIRIEIYTQLGTLYRKHGITDARLGRMTAAYDEFEKKRGDKTISTRWAAFVAVYEKIEESPIQKVGGGAKW